MCQFIQSYFVCEAIFFSSLLRSETDSPQTKRAKLLKRYDDMLMSHSILSAIISQTLIPRSIPSTNQYEVMSLSQSCSAVHLLHSRLCSNDAHVSKNIIKKSNNAIKLCETTSK